MQDQELKTGDFVEFLSGGPTMTVIKQSDIPGRGWHCGWFAQGEYKTADFLISTLKKVNTPKKYTGLL